MQEDGAPPSLPPGPTDTRPPLRAALARGSQQSSETLPDTRGGRGVAVETAPQGAGAGRGGPAAASAARRRTEAAAPHRAAPRLRAPAPPPPPPRRAPPAAIPCYGRASGGAHRSDIIPRTPVTPAPGAVRDAARRGAR